MHTLGDGHAERTINDSPTWAVRRNEDNERFEPVEGIMQANLRAGLAARISTRQNDYASAITLRTVRMSATRLVVPSFLPALDRWLATVETESPNSYAISLFE